MLSQALRGGGYYVFAMSRCPMLRSAFLSLRTSTERILIKFAGHNHYKQQMKWLQFGKLVPGTREHDITENSNRCCSVANDSTIFTVHTARCVCRAGESNTHMQRRRRHMAAPQPLKACMLKRGRLTGNMEPEGVGGWFRDEVDGEAA